MINKIDKWELKARVNLFINYFLSIKEEQMFEERNKYIMRDSFCFKGEAGENLKKIAKEFKVYLVNKNSILPLQKYNLYIKDIVAYAELK